MNLNIQKALIVVSLIGGVASLAGTWVYVPKQVEQVERIQRADHDLLIRLETKMEVVESRLQGIGKKLERSGIGMNYETDIDAKNWYGYSNSVRSAASYWNELQDGRVQRN